MKSIEMDRSQRLKEQPRKGHNRLHPDIPPALEVDPGEDVVLQMLDATDAAFGPRATEANMATMDAGARTAATSTSSR